MGQSDEPGDRESVVTRRVLVGGGVDAYGNGDEVGEHESSERDDDGKPEPLTYYVEHRPFIPIRITEVSPKDLDKPFQILDRKRLIEVVALSELLKHGQTRLIPTFRESESIRGDEIARGQLDDHEADNADQPQHNEHVAEPTNEIAGHDLLAGGERCRLETGADSTAPFW